MKIQLNWVENGRKSADAIPHKAQLGSRGTRSSSVKKNVVECKTKGKIKFGIVKEASRISYHEWQQ
jgi:hypothetical protein